MGRKRSTKVTAQDCRKCGLCCMALHDQGELADLTEKDLERLDRRWARAYVVFWTPFDLMLAAIDGRRAPPAAIRTEWRRQRCGPFKGMEACTCVALRGSMMHRTSCSIYAKRPESCREAVKPGDDTCLKIRNYWREQLEAA